MGPSEAILFSLKRGDSLVKFLKESKVDLHFTLSHFVKALEVAMLLIVYMTYGCIEGGGFSGIMLILCSRFVVIPWLFAPYIFNPSSFGWKNLSEDLELMLLPENVLDTRYHWYIGVVD